MAEFKVGDKVRVLSGGDGVITYGPVNSTFMTNILYVVKQDGDNERTFQASDLEPLPAFTVGDKVRYAAAVVTIKAGPFLSTVRDRAEFWVVEFDSGQHATPLTSWLTPLPADEPVKVGDTVMVVVADPGIREGDFVGLVGTVTALDDYRGRVKVRFGDGTGRHGDKANGHWWCEKVEKVDTSSHVHKGIVYDLSAEYRDREGDVWRFEDIAGTVRGEIDGRKIDTTSLSLAYAVREYGPLSKRTD
ncbi:phiSA1p31-related protein [Streptomyces niveus]|uniref:phiSA1p31-related protein n=1 Tax=Streptomyces niveus TaxID=193462 RepID=UPI00366596F4